MKVKLAADCYVDKVVCKAGDIVDLPEEIAEHFGEVIPEVVEENSTDGTTETEKPAKKK